MNKGHREEGFVARMGHVISQHRRQVDHHCHAGYHRKIGTIASLGDEDPGDVQALQKALEKAENQAEVPPVETQILHAENFIGSVKKGKEWADVAVHAAQRMVFIRNSCRMVWQRDAPGQKAQQFQRRWQRTKSGQDPEEVQVAVRVRVERLENAPAALGDTESTVVRGLVSALKEARRVAQGRLFAASPVPTQAAVVVAPADPSESQVGHSGDGTRQFDGETRQVCVSSVVRHPSGESEHQRARISRQTFHQDADEDRPRKFFGCSEQPV